MLRLTDSAMTGEGKSEKGKVRSKSRKIIFFIDLIYRSSNKDYLSGVGAAGLGAGRGEFVVDGGHAIFASRRSSHNGSGSFTG